MNNSKQLQMPHWLSKTLLAGLGLILVLMPVHAFLSTWGGSSIGPLWLWKSWKEILLVCLVVLTLGWLLSKPPVIKDLARSPLAVLLGAYLLLSAVMALLLIESTGQEATFVGVAMNLRYLGAGALAYLLFRYGAVAPEWITRAFWFVLAAGVTVAAIGIMQVLLIPADFLAMFGYEKGVTIAPATLVDDNPDKLRAFATLRGPNDFGAYLILPLIIVIAWLKKVPLWVSAGSLVVLSWALVLSSSRSAWLGAIAAAVGLVILQAGRRLGLYKIGALVLSLIVAGSILLYASIHIPALRMAVFHSSPGDPSLTEGSTDDHIEATLGGIDRAVDAPLGCGPGCAGPASYYGDSPKISENYFVQVAEETGLLGLALFTGLLGIVSVKLLRLKENVLLGRVLFVALMGHIVVGMLLHVWVDDPLSITWWLLASAVIGYNERQQWKKSKDSSPSRT